METLGLVPYITLRSIINHNDITRSLLIGKASKQHPEVMSAPFGNGEGFSDPLRGDYHIIRYYTI